MQISNDSFRGKTIISADGRLVGEIASFSVDDQALRIAALEVRLRKEAAQDLGARGSLLHPSKIELPADMIQSVGDTVVLNTKIEDLRPLVSSSSSESHLAGSDQAHA